ncbi:MAG TPA: hypothetical protein VD816_14630, partial [Ohtaekwangia sp.]|nr:hypothetical protein [Ohtaekwangia sp.]
AAPWHGTDILLNSLQAYSGPCKIHCYIAGNIPGNVQQRIQDFSRITWLPTQSGKALDDLVNKCHIGVGTLGLSEHFLRQACTLKVREYWSRGLPFIVGYDDVDLVENDAIQPFFLKVEIDAGRQCFNLDEVVAFANRVYHTEGFSEEMRSLAIQHIDYRVKGKAYADFLRQLQG